MNTLKSVVNFGMRNIVEAVVKIRESWFIVRNYVRNLKVFHRLLVEHYPWDSGYGWLALRLVLEDVRQHLKDSPLFPSINIKKDIKDVTIAIELLKRIEGDNYGLDCFDYNIRVVKEYESGYKEITIDVTKLKDLPTVKAKYGVEKSQKENDLELLTKLLKKRMKNWWN